MIEYEKEYLEFIRQRGVGSNDHVASSPDSYLSYIHSVAMLLGQDITSATLRSEQDITDIVNKISGQRSAKTIQNYCSAMRQYVAFVLERQK